LFELRRYGRKRGVELWPDAVDGRDYCGRDAAGNDGVFDSRCAGLVCEESSEYPDHVASPS
ncbi:MAG: hypothetical protein WB444_10305, partial [Gallionella sp.]